MKVNTERLEEARKSLLETLSPGDTVYTKLNHVSRSGMSRDISVYVFRNNEPQLLDWAVSVVTENPLSRNEGVRIGGCGMDMGFALVYHLSRALFPEYKCLGEHKCPSPDHINGPRDSRPPYSESTIHQDGYALKHRWF